MNEALVQSSVPQRQINDKKKKIAPLDHIFFKVSFTYDFKFVIFIYFLNFILSFLHLLTCVYIIWASFPYPSKQNLFCPLVLQFCWRENISDNKKDIAFLLVWDKDSYTERFLELLPCTCVLQPTLVHLHQTSSLLPGPLPIAASASLRWLYLLLYSGHINHFQVLGFLPFPYSSCMCSPLSVWRMSTNITAFALGL
jgi:hypothetical protein